MSLIVFLPRTAYRAKCEGARQPCWRLDRVPSGALPLVLPEQRDRDSLVLPLPDTSVVCLCPHPNCRELNLYTVSPFALVDVARLGGTHSPEFQGNRYAAGGGVRFSLVKFNVDVGYGFNVNRQRGDEGKEWVHSTSP